MIYNFELSEADDTDSDLEQNMRLRSLSVNTSEGDENKSLWRKSST
jgi:hypothetical protein